jgi:hypothetical protein
MLRTSKGNLKKPVQRTPGPRSLIMRGLLVVVCAAILQVPARAQVRGVYPPGLSAFNSGVTPESGFSYSNLFLFYSRDHMRGPHGELLATGRQSVLMDMNSFVWVSNEEVLGGAKVSLAVTLPIANNSLTSDIEGAINGGGGLADSFYQFILGWEGNRVAVRGMYGVLAPTGRFNAGASDNVGSGYWTQTPASGQTFYLTKNKTTSLSVFEMYEFHSTQEGTQIHPGQTLDIDLSLTQTIALPDDIRLQMGLVGYGQWQTTDKSGPTITSEQSKAHYRVHAVGFGANVLLPARKVSLGVKYFKEFSNRSTFQGSSLQISTSIAF